MILFLGLVMLFLGLPMVIVGHVTLPGNIIIPARRSRWAGATLLAFFPVAFAVRFLVGWLETSHFFWVQLVYWLIAAACLIGAFMQLAPVFFGSSTTNDDDRTP